MNHAQIEKKLVEQISKLPVEEAREVLDFAENLARQRSAATAKHRPLGLLKGQASYKMADDFALSDEALLRS